MCCVAPISAQPDSSAPDALFPNQFSLFPSLLSPQIRIIQILFRQLARHLI